MFQKGPAVRNVQRAWGSGRGVPLPPVGSPALAARPVTAQHCRSFRTRFVLEPF